MSVAALYDVIVVPFPFIDEPAAKRRPALVISGEAWNRASGHVVCAMITAANRSAWPLDVTVAELAAAGLDKPCVVRMKLFTLDAALVVRRAGQLGASDRTRVAASLDALRVQSSSAA